MLNVQHESMNLEADSVTVLHYADAVKDALMQVMQADSRVILIGEGVPDPKAIFGTTAGLQDRFGQERVQDMPLSENGMTGICIGAALAGLRPVMVHQRVDFALLAMDQLVNNAAKWRYMFAGQQSVPLTVRLIVGRGWGQGPQHSQNLHALFASIPGLRVITPASAYDAKGMLIAAIQCPDPVLVIEHRWLHGIYGHVPHDYYEAPLQGAQVLTKGEDITIACFSYMVIEGLKAQKWLLDQGVMAQVIDMRSIAPLDDETVIQSVQKTKQLLVVDTGHEQGNIGHVLISHVVKACFSILNEAPELIACANHPVPTSHFMADHYYPDAVDIAVSVMRLKNKKYNQEKMIEDLRKKESRDQPDADFTGPF